MPSSELFSRGNWLLIIIGAPRDDNRLDVSGGGLLVARWRLLPILILIELISFKVLPVFITLNSFIKNYQILL